MSWLLNRLKEPSTWRGIVWLLTALGVSLSPESWQYLTTAGMAVAGLIGCLTAEKAHRVEVQLPPISLVSRPAADAQPERLRQPMSSVSNTQEAADSGHDNSPGWGG